MNCYWFINYAAMLLLFFFIQPNNFVKKNKIYFLVFSKNILREFNLPPIPT